MIDVASTEWVSVFRADCLEEKIDIINGIFLDFLPVFFRNVQDLLRRGGGEFFVGGKVSKKKAVEYGYLNQFKRRIYIFY